MKITFAKSFQDSFDKCFSMNPYYSIPRWFRDIKHEIKMAWQRVFRGYDDDAIWNFHHHFSTLAINCLTTFKKSHIGYPVNLKSSKEWDKILDEIINGFKLSERVTCEPEIYFKSGKKDRVKKFKAGQKKMNKDIKKFEKAMELFVEYYHNLWD